jgi:hypothetical protein
LELGGKKWNCRYLPVGKPILGVKTAKQGLRSGSALYLLSVAARRDRGRVHAAPR